MSRVWLRALVLCTALLFAWAGDLGEEAVAPAVPSATKPAVYRSPNHICLSADARRAFVVNETSDSVSILDLAERKVVGEIAVGSRPATAVASPDGRWLYVTTRWASALDFVDLTAGRVVRSVRTGYEPYGVALSPDGREIYVANSQSDSVSLISASSGEVRRTVAVGRDPRYLTVTPDGSRLVVGNGLSRELSLVDIATGRVESRGFERSSLLRHVAVSHDGRWAFAAHVVSHDEQFTLQMERGWIHSNGFSIADLRAPGHGVTLLLDRLLEGAANPWGMALSRDDRRLYVTLAGVHQVAIVDVGRALELAGEVRGPQDVTALRRNVEILERRGIARRVDAGGIGPRGVALAEARGELLVANYFSDAISVLGAVNGELLAVIPLGPQQELTLWRRGELIFNDARICFQKWFSCASCHQEDATMDALNWDLANDGLGNPKNAKSMHDIADTWPGMWSGVRRDMDAAVQAGQRFLGFLPDPDRHEALMEYLGNPPRAPNPFRDENPMAVERGEQIFNTSQCSTCHPPPTFSDGKQHDLGFVGTTDLRSRFDTPSLRDCYRTAPFLHDGRAATLRSLFTEHNPADLHGRTSHLLQAELEDLLAYLRSL